VWPKAWFPARVGRGEITLSVLFMDGKNRLSGFKPIKNVGLYYGTGENEIPFWDFPRYKKEQNNNNKNISSLTNENNSTTSFLLLKHFMPH